MEQLNDYILDAIITLRQKKKQSNEDPILNIFLSKMESLTKAKLVSSMNLLNSKGFILNPLWRSGIPELENRVTDYDVTKPS